MSKLNSSKEDLISHDNEKPKSYGKESAFLVGVTGMSLTAGFGFTLALAKKKDPGYFNKGLIGTKGVVDSGGSLALRALGYGTLCSVAGVSLLTVAVCGFMGITSLTDLRTKLRQASANKPRKENPGRSEFGSVRELVNYLIDEDKRTKEHKTSSAVK